MDGGSGGSTNTIQNADPWRGQQPYLQDIFSRGQTLGNLGWNTSGVKQAPYDTTGLGRGLLGNIFGSDAALQQMAGTVPNASVGNIDQILARQSPFTIASQQLAAQRATDPNSLVGRSQSMIGDTLSGKYMDANSNPYFKSGLNDALGQASSIFAGQFGGPAGQNLGNSGYQEALSRGLGAVATNAYGNLYSKERQNQLQATELAPALQNADVSQLAQVGLSQEARRQQELDAPWQSLSNYSRAISGQFGGTTNTSSPYFSNPLAQAMGMGLGGYGLYNAFGGGSAGTTTAGAALPAFYTQGLGAAGVGTGMTAETAPYLMAAW